MSDLIDLKSHSVNTVLNLLLKDRTTNKNIIFATDAYDNIDFTTEITKKLLLSGSVDIRPRVLKSLEEQTQRTRKKAEVFTPVWICNKMNNHCDTEWFCRENVFNIEQNHNWIVTTEKITFPKEKSWKDYVNSKRLEITCGEAPYIVSRYDVSTGNVIPIEKRIGILDRKLRVINENVHTHKLWNQWVYRAFESTYGYEFQGDNLLIARINLIETFCEYTRHKWNVEPSNSSLKHIANIISWNIWQMDGIHGVIPYVGAICEQENEPYQMNLFEMWGMNDETEIVEKLPETIDCNIYNWCDNKVIAYNSKERERMKFDFVIGNPPYQEDTEGAGRQAIPVYNLFFEQAKKMNPESISMIIPSRWFSGGMGLNQFREDMINDRSLKVICDYTNAKDCFPDNSISGGVNYFVWKRDYKGDCKFINTMNGVTTQSKRPLNEFPVLVRYNQAIEIIHKIKNKTKSYIEDIASGLMPFGLSTSYRGRKNKSENDNLTLYASNCVTYISKSEIDKGYEYLDKYKVLISKTGAEHAGEPNKDGKFKVIPSSMKVIGPNEICTHSYFLIGATLNKSIAENIYKYMKTQCVRFLMLIAMSGFGLSKNVLIFVPLQDFTSSSDIDWSQSISDIDKQLYKKYNLSEEEINFIETNVKEME